MQIKDYNDALNVKIGDVLYLAEFGCVENKRPHCLNVREIYGNGVYLTISDQCGVSADFDFCIKPNPEYEILAVFTTAQECIDWYKKKIGKAVMDNLKQRQKLNEKLESLLDEYIAVS